MKKVLSAFIFSALGLLFLQNTGIAASTKLPVIDGKRTVATVNGEPITMEQLKRAIVASHSAGSKEKKTGQIDYSNIMSRLINSRLIVLEARNMGLDELPEISRMVESYSREALMKVLLEQYVQGVKADENVVEAIYQMTVREWQIKSILFKKEEDVKKAQAALKAGKTFEEVADQAAAAGTGRIDAGGEYIKNKQLAPAVARIVSEMEVGSVSPIVSAGKRGFILFKLVGMRIPEVENPEARKKAQRQALNQKRAQTAKDFYTKLKNKYVKLDKQLLDELDYESEEPGMEKLLTDKRVIAKIKRDKPITVAELSEALKRHFYHGIHRAIESRRINKKKEDILEDLLQKRILIREAYKRDIDKTETYRERVAEYEFSLIFGAFVKKVVTPGIKLDLDDLRSYYKEHREEYTTPEMVRIKSLAFYNRKDAIDALEKLTKGTDFNWLGSHAQGQVAQDTAERLKLEGKLLTVRGLPEGLQKSVTDAAPGDFRLYESPEGIFYVLYIYHVVAPNPMPFENVKEDIAEEVYNHKIKDRVEMWAQKLKKHYPVKVYLSDLSNLES